MYQLNCTFDTAAELLAVAVFLESRGHEMKPAEEKSKSKKTPTAQAKVAESNVASAPLAEPLATPSPPSEAAVTEKTPPGATTPSGGDVKANPTLDDVRAALSAVNAKGGLPACRAVLDEFKASRVGDLKEKDYAAVIAAARREAK